MTVALNESKRLELKPSKKIGGTITVPGDKSIAHRGALLSILATSELVVRNFPDNEDCARSLDVAKRLGVTVESANDTLHLTPPTRPSLDSESPIDCGNSGTTARLLIGILAGLRIRAELIGDASLSRRPMKRVINPLIELGGAFVHTDGCLPVTILPDSPLMPGMQRLQLPSAQVKSSLILAALAAGVQMRLEEMIVSRDHTELMIRHLKGDLALTDHKAVLLEDPNDPRKKRLTRTADYQRSIELGSGTRISGGEIDIPGDISTAAFFFGLAAISKKSITVTNVGLNPTRTGFLDILRQFGATVDISDKKTFSGEVRGTVTVTGGVLKGRKIQGEQIVDLIDEIPILSVVAACAEGTTVIRDASELRVKETDRLAAIATNLRAMGVKAGELEDGLAIEGGKQLHGADIATFGDHRIAMAFAIAAQIAAGPSSLDDASCVAVSCPSFFELLSQVSR